jgi:hypothetical protein
MPVWRSDNEIAKKLCADIPARGSVTLDRASVHLLSNHLTVILGFVELMLADAPPDDPHRQDLIEVRAAVIEAANLIAQTTRLQ